MLRSGNTTSRAQVSSEVRVKVSVCLEPGAPLLRVILFGTNPCSLTVMQVGQEAAVPLLQARVAKVTRATSPRG